MRRKLFGKLFRGRDAPSNSTAGSGYGFFMGNTASGKRVNARSAMQMTAVYSCVRILSEAVASLPLQFYRYNDNEGKEKAVDHPLYFLLHDEPNPEMTSFVFRETLMTHLLLWGNAYSQIIRNGKGEVVALYPLMPDRMTVDRDEHGRLYYEYLVYDGDDVDGRTGTDPKASGKIVRLHPADVLHILGLGFDGLVGYSPIAMAKNAIGLAIAAEEYGSKFYANSVIVTVKEMKNYLRVDFDDDDVLLSDLIEQGQQICMDVARITDEDEFEDLQGTKIAVQYAAAYLYEHREEADHHQLVMNLRSLLFGVRKPGF